MLALLVVDLDVETDSIYSLQPSSCFDSLRFFSQSERYFSYPSLYGALTFDKKMSSPRGFDAGGMGARGIDWLRAVPERGDVERAEA